MTSPRPFRFGFTGGVSSKPEKLRASAREVCEKLADNRDRYGISYWSAPIDARPELMALVVRRLAGT